MRFTWDSSILGRGFLSIQGDKLQFLGVEIYNKYGHYGLSI
jgi:hypothetical protein